jgi:hypothetical protein
MVSNPPSRPSWRFTATPTDGRERLDPDGYQVDFACTLAQRGFVVVAPEIVGFGQRISRECSENKGFYPCWHLAPFALMMGGSVVGMRTWDAMRAIDFAQTLPEVDRNRIGAMGISGGGMNTFFATALDDRIKACVISGYFCDWRYGLLGKFHCFCNFVPGLLRLGELNDLAGLIAPRPCLVEAGSRDQYFPYQPSLDTVDRARRCWQAFGQESLLELDAFDGRHRISGRRAYDFLKEHV